MLRFLAIISVCFGLVGCSGAMVAPKLQAATDPGLARHGWLEIANMQAFQSNIFKSDRVYQCRQASCGGLGFIGRAHATLDPSSKPGMDMLKLENDPKYSAEWIKAAATQYMPSSLTRFQGRYVDVRKSKGRVEFLISGIAAAPQGVVLHMTARLVFQGLNGTLTGGGGPTESIASQRLAQAQRLR